VKGQNQGKVSYNKGLSGKTAVFGSTRTKPIKANLPASGRKRYGREVD
jgi:hypothetical protein